MLKAFIIPWAEGEWGRKEESRRALFPVPKTEMQTSRESEAATGTCSQLVARNLLRALLLVPRPNFRMAENLVRVSMRGAADTSTTRPFPGPLTGCHAKTTLRKQEEKSLLPTLALRCLSSTLYWQTLKIEPAIKKEMFKERQLQDHKIGQRGLGLERQ